MHSRRLVINLLFPRRGWTSEAWGICQSRPRDANTGLPQNPRLAATTDYHHQSHDTPEQIHNQRNCNVSARWLTDSLSEWRKNKVTEVRPQNWVVLFVLFPPDRTTCQWRRNSDWRLHNKYWIVPSTVPLDPMYWRCERNTSDILKYHFWGASNYNQETVVVGSS